MSHKNRNAALKNRDQVKIFTALAEKTRLSIIKKLSDGKPHSISELTEGTKLTRQAVTKHLRVLGNARIVHSVRSGRENLFELNPKPIKDTKKYLDFVSQQ
jgi:DNA-binding transcriptional ArsR family regulator